ncbi:hypothetical protein QY95_00943 [Bacillus thermotolerans]|uniref:Uncharacterized protein n=1 Tax=Bacillus thermotolerans TaxID=1221996 RepID=A0A0F5I6U0_BACTR|nr:hypothetical protein QY95_00943 [Bacillus thermotolerans]
MDCRKLGKVEEIFRESAGEGEKIRDYCLGPQVARGEFSFSLGVL